MKVLFVASEIFPYAKSGGLGDVASALPRALEHLDDLQITRIMPLYQSIHRERFGIVQTGEHYHFSLQGVAYTFDLYHTVHDPSIRFLYHPTLCERTGYYGDAQGAYEDNAIRFGLFAHAVIAYMREHPIDLLHLNDWQSALIAPLSKRRFETKIVFTIHNLAYQGVFDKAFMEPLELDWRDFTPMGLEYYDAINCLKGGIAFADAITTVSPTYAQEIQTPLFGEGLEAFLALHADRIQGILNGIDMDYFDPTHDADLVATYDRDHLGEKKANKAFLLDRVGLEGWHRPLFGFIGRLGSQKGVDMLLRALVHLKDLHANFIFLGSGDPVLEAALTQLNYPNVAVICAYDETLSKQIYAGSDFLMMPSVYEPCGLNQMIALRYGTLPIVRETGGLKDTIEDLHTYNKQGSKGPGITYHDQSVFAFLIAIAKALSLYGDKKEFKKLRRHAMRHLFSWERSAQAYHDLYRSLTCPAT